MPSFQAHCLCEKGSMRRGLDGAFRIRKPGQFGGRLCVWFFFLFFSHPAGWHDATDVRRRAARLVSTPHLDNRGELGERDEAEEEKQPVHQGWGSGTIVCVSVCVCIGFSACVGSRNVPPPHGNNCKNTGKSVKSRSSFSELMFHNRAPGTPSVPPSLPPSFPQCDLFFHWPPPIPHVPAPPSVLF